MIAGKSREEISLVLLRSILGIIIASHGWHRILTGGYEPFGEWLNAQGFPFGLGIAVAVTLFEVCASPFLVLGKKLPYICSIYIVIFFTLFMFASILVFTQWLASILHRCISFVCLIFTFLFFSIPKVQ